jgi:uncharacterized membrane protein YjgN (DUF898 family)
MLRDMSYDNGGYAAFDNEISGKSSEYEPRKIAFRFSGSAYEYFKISTVNVLLSIVTLGIYSAWAKVRTKQYFYRHTHIDGSSFDYTANPLSILRGRIIVGGFLALLAASQLYSAALYGILLIVFLFAVPFLVVQSLRFNARNSVFRNIRFSFAGTTGEAYGVFALSWLFPLITCGIAYPYSVWRLTQFYVTRHLYGDERLDWSAKSSQYYKLFLVPLIIQIALVAGAASFAYVVGQRGDGHDLDNDGVMSAAIVLIAIGFYAVLFAIAAYVKARTFNLVYNELTFGGHKFEATQRARDLMGLYFTNAVAVFVSLGLLAPWARVRLARYKAEHLTLVTSGPLLGAANPMATSASSLGDAATDLGDIGLDLGF